MSAFKPEKRLLPAKLDAIYTQIQCPSHQVWPFRRTAITGSMPLATLSLKTFEWHCSVCGDRGLLTRAFQGGFLEHLRERAKASGKRSKA